MKRATTSLRLIAPTALVLAFLLGFAQRGLGQCQIQMYPQYSSYSSFTTDGTHIYTSVTVSGTTYGYCPPCSPYDCNSVLHTPKALNVIGSVGGWSTGTPVHWNYYLNYTNNQSLAATEGYEYTWCYSTQVQCTVVGVFYNILPAVGYLSILHTTLRLTVDMGMGTCLTQPYCIGGVTPICSEPEIFDGAPCAAGWFCGCLAYRLSRSQPYSCIVAICNPTDVLPGPCDHY